MADTIKLQNSGSPERVAHDLMEKIRIDEMITGRAAILDLYAECLRATKGLRAPAQPS